MFGAKPSDVNYLQMFGAKPSDVNYLQMFGAKPSDVNYLQMFGATFFKGCLRGVLLYFCEKYLAVRFQPNLEHHTFFW
jgi:hypothetical protein